MIQSDTICGKTIYSDRVTAMVAIRGQQADHRAHVSNKKAGKTYFCNPCNGWHIFTEGKKRPKKRNSDQSLKHNQPLSEQSMCKKWAEPLIIHDARKFKIK